MSGGGGGGRRLVVVDCGRGRQSGGGLGSFLKAISSKVNPIKLVGMD